MSESRTQSTFVTVVAWIFIVLSSVGTMIAVLENILIQTVLRSPALDRAMQAPLAGAQPFADSMLPAIQWILLAVLALSVLMLTSSVGLLRRRNWARLSMIGLLSLTILWQVVGLAFQFVTFSFTRQQLSAVAVQGGPDMASYLIAVSVVSGVLALVVSGLCGWIIKRLLSPVIATEFGR